MDTNEICELKFLQIEKEINRANIISNKNSEDIVDLKKLMERLTVLLESTNLRINAIEQNQKTGFLETDVGKYIIKFFTWLLGFIIVTLLANKFLDPSIFF